MTNRTPSRVGWPAEEVLLVPYLARMVEEMAPDTPLLESTGWTLNDLRQDGVRVPVSLCLEILERARRAGMPPDMAVRLGGALDLRSHGFLGYAVLASDNLGEALDRAVRYLRTRTGLLSVRLECDGDRAAVHFEEAVPLGLWFPWIMDGVVAALVHISRQMFGVSPTPETEIRLGYPERSHHRLLREATDGELLFDCGSTRVVFPAHWLELSVSTADPQLVRLAVEQCEQELSRLRRENELLARVREFTDQYLQEPRPMDAVADALHMTPRTLRRRLVELGTSWKGLVEQRRRALAMDRLRHTDETVEEIAAAIGYTDASNFGRAFRRWAGLSPRDWRRRVRSERGGGEGQQGS